jgi:hypothetical protein
MKRFNAICGAFAVGILLVGSVHAGPPRSRQRSAHYARQGSVQRWYHHSGRHWIVLPPTPELLPWQWQPEQLPGSWGYYPNSGDYNPDSGTDDPNAAGYDPNNRDAQLQRGISNRNVARPAVAPNVGDQRGANDLNSESDDPNAGADDPNSGEAQPGRDSSSGNAARPAVTPSVGGQRRLPRISNGSSRIPVSPPRRR